MDAADTPTYQVRIVPALRRIQEKYGYLNRDAMGQFARESGIPMYRLQEVASFFPHFRLKESKRVTLRVCRDMACHMAGSGQILKELGKLNGEQVQVEGVSCLGRCDRPPAACISVRNTNVSSEPYDRVAGRGYDPVVDHYYHGRSAEQLKQIIEGCLSDETCAPAEDQDAHRCYPRDDWEIDPYKGAERDYAAVKKAVAVRNESIQRAADILRSSNWTWGHIEQFQMAAEGGAWADRPANEEIGRAVRAWQSETDWAKGAELGGWANALLAEFDDSRADLRGMGGAGIPATQKWRDVRDAVRTARIRRLDDRAFIIVNGDECEPGTFKDRELLLHFPHVVVEGVIVAGLISEASEGFIYIRHEYHEQIEACTREIERAEKLGVCGRNASVLGRPFPISVFTSPGGYICGEQSALVEAMSDRRAEPRNMPPKLETNGLDDRPTLVSNVETFAWVPYILLRGGKNYGKLGVNTWPGKRFFSVCGDVNRPGVYEVPMGMTVRELIFGEKYCQGIAGGKELKALAPSGPSAGFLPAKLTATAGLPRDHVNNKVWQALAERRGLKPSVSELDILDMELELNLFRAISPTQALGAGLVVYAEGRDMAEQAVNAIEFFRNESCGKCVPCRMGSQKLAILGRNLLNQQIDGGQWNNQLLPIIRELDDAMGFASICGLGRSVAVPLRTVIRFFGDDLKAYLRKNVEG